MKLGRVFLFMLGVLLWNCCPAQKSPYKIRNYSPKEYNGFSQMWHAAQDENGLMYFAGSTSVFAYDGTSFDPIVIKSGSAIRQIFIDSVDETVYVGTVGDFGYLENDPTTGKQHYVSLINSLSVGQKEFLDVWTIAKLDGKIYFQSSERIFVCADRKIVRVIEPGPDNSFALMFAVGGRLYVRQRNVGLMEIRNDQLVLTPGGERFAVTRIPGMMRWNDKQNLIVTADSGFVLMHTSGIMKDVYSSGSTDDFMMYSGALGCTWVNDSTFVVNSRSGIAFYNKKMELIQIIDKASGLPNQAISSVFIDLQKNIWLTHSYGLSMICYNTPMLYFGQERGYSGLLECLTRYRNTFYLATSEGLFRQKKGTSDINPTFERDERIPKTEVWDLGVIDSFLYIATSRGLYYMYNDRVAQLSNNYTNRVFASKVPNEIVSMEKASLSIYHSRGLTSPELVQHYTTPGVDFINGGHSDTSSNGERTMWFADRFLRAVRFEFNVHDTSYTLDVYDTLNGLPVEAMYPVQFSNELYFITVDSAYRYDATLDKPGGVCFVQAPEFFTQLFSGDVSGLQFRFDQRTFLRNQGNNCVVIGNDPHGGFLHYNFNAVPFMGEIALRNIYAEPSGVVWLISEEWLARLNTKQEVSSDVSYNTVVRFVRIGNDSLIYSGDALHVTQTEALPYLYNSITFSFSALFYEFENNINYFYQLEGYDTTWYKSKNLREKSYTNLPEGTYTFHVKAINPYGRTGNESSYTFTILPPWYRTLWAYVFYTLGAILCVFVIVRISARRLRLQKEKLELLVTERTAEVVEQKHQLEKQQVDLQEAYTGIQDSIQYSQRIQNAILPTSEEIKRIVPESFVLFFPRDIVSGDFYWFAEKNNLKFIACVDCTGHGVPGALMSMIGNTLLNQIIIEKNITSPDEILNHLHIGVRQALKQDVGGDTRDGMDLSLIVIDENKSQLVYSGANRNLWIIRGGKLIETKANKFPIAGSQLEQVRRFTAHTIALQKDDAIYMTTDGYADQFGGEKGKKFMVKQLTRLILDVHQKPMTEQRQILEQRFLGWKQNHEQVDDVLIIGIRV